LTEFLTQSKNKDSLVTEKRHEILVTIGPAYQFHKTDWNGQIIEDSKNVFASMKCTLQIDEVRRVCFGIHAEYPKINLKESQKDNLSDELNYLTWIALKGYLPTLKGMNLFHIHEIPITYYLNDQLPDPQPNSSELLAPYKCNISNEALDDLIAQFDKYIKARKSFDYAVKQLTNFSDYDPFGVKHYQSEIFSFLSFLQRSLAAADVGQLYSWYKEKQSGIHNNFEEMLRRKQARHPGYKRAQDYIRSSLYSYHTPDVWREDPPVIQQIK
jgi:hypothetical protein